MGEMAASAVVFQHGFAKRAVGAPSAPCMLRSLAGRSSAMDDATSRDYRSLEVSTPTQIFVFRGQVAHFKSDANRVYHRVISPAVGMF